MGRPWRAVGKPVTAGYVETDKGSRGMWVLNPGAGGKAARDGEVQTSPMEELEDGGTEGEEDEMGKDVDVGVPEVEPMVKAGKPEVSVQGGQRSSMDARV